MIKIKLEESGDLFSSTSKFGTLGWWVEVNRDTIYNVSGDGGPGDHMGFLWAGDNLKKMLPDSNQDDVLTFKLYYPTSGYYEPEELDNYREFGMEDDEYEHLYSALMEHNAEWWQKRHQKILEKIFTKWQRVLYHKTAKEVSVMVGARSPSNHRTLISFMMQLSEHHPIENVYVETLDEERIWSRTPFENAITSKRF